MKIYRLRRCSPTSTSLVLMNVSNYSWHFALVRHSLTPDTHKRCSYFEASHLRIDFLLTQITVRCGDVAGAAPFRSWDNATEQGKRIVFELRFRIGRYDDLAVRHASTVNAFPILSIDNITLAHQIEHFFEFYLQRPIDLRQIFQQFIARFFRAKRSY